MSPHEAKLKGVTERAFDRRPLDRSEIRANIWSAPGRPPAPGRVTSASINGMWIETGAALDEDSPVDVELFAGGGYSMRFEGRVARREATGMAIELVTDDRTWQFRSSFVELASTPSRDPPTVAVRLTKGSAPTPLRERVGSIAELWQRVLEDFSSDAAHQAFIQECIRTKRLEFAIARYREQKAARPDDANAERYLAQVGTIIGFYALKPPENDEDRERLFKRIVVLVFFVLLAVALIAAGAMIAREASKPTPSPFGSSGLQPSTRGALTRPA